MWKGCKLSRPLCIHAQNSDFSYDSFRNLFDTKEKLKMEFLDDIVGHEFEHRVRNGI